MNAARRVRRVTLAGTALLDRSRIRTASATLPSRLLPTDAPDLLTRSAARAESLRAPIGDLDAVLQAATDRDATAGPAPGDERAGRGALTPADTTPAAAAQVAWPPATAALRRPATPAGAATVSTTRPGGALRAASPTGRHADAAGDGLMGRPSRSSPTPELGAVVAGRAGAHAEVALARAWPVPAAGVPPAPLPRTFVEGRARPSAEPDTDPAGQAIVDALPAAGGHGPPDPEAPGMRTDGLAGLVNRWRSVAGTAAARSATAPAAGSPAGRGEPGGDAPGGPPPAARPGPPAVPDVATVVVRRPSDLESAPPIGAEVIGLSDGPGGQAATAEQDRLEQLLDELVRREALANGLEDLP